MTEITYRHGLPADALCVGVLATQVFLDTYATDGIRPDLAREVLADYTPDAFAIRISESNEKFILAEKSGHLIAFAEYDHGVDCPVPVSGNACGSELIRLYVLSRFQRIGIGRQLLSRTETMAQHQGMQLLWLTAWEGNANALGFYLANGYDDVGVTQYCIEDKMYINRILVKRLV